MQHYTSESGTVPANGKPGSFPSSRSSQQTSRTKNGKRCNPPFRHNGQGLCAGWQMATWAASLEHCHEAPRTGRGWCVQAQWGPLVLQRPSTAPKNSEVGWWARMARILEEVPASQKHLPDLGPLQACPDIAEGPYFPNKNVSHVRKHRLAESTRSIDVMLIHWFSMHDNAIHMHRLQ